jgi:hypothetical protein
MVNLEGFQELMVTEPELGYRMLIVRMMKEHRGFSTRSLAAKMGRSYNFVSLSLRPMSVRPRGTRGTKAGDNKYSIESMHRRLDEIEAALTGTECGCTVAAVEELKDQLAASMTEEFPDARR